jgi:OHCU decarboxylase
MRLDELNALDRAAAAQALRRCCGSSRWAAMMAAARPFVSAEAMALTADIIWSALNRTDWLEAFAAHPRIGDRVGTASPDGSPAPERAWAAQEQSGVDDGSRARFTPLHAEYEARFGYIFIVCAAGKSGRELQDLLERRLANAPDVELREAAEQQRQITRLRLEKLLT